MKKILLFLFLLIIPFNVMALSVTASSAVLMDIDSGRVLYEKDAHNPRLIASTTKIMTAALAIEHGNLESIVTVGEEVLTMYGSNIYIELGEKMSLRDLLYGLILRSGNDSAIVIATYIGGTEENFVQMMNSKAREIGMTNTTFGNSHGLDEITQNYSTAYDMALLSSYAYSFDVYKEISKTKKYITKTDNKSYVWNNRNKLLSNYQYATGGKNGYTPSAGRTLVTTATKDNLNLTAVTLNDPNEYVSHEAMYEYAFSKYKSIVLINKDSFIPDDYYKGRLYVKKSFSYPLTTEEENKIDVTANILKLKNYENGDKVGDVIVTFDDKEIYREPIFIQKEKSKSFWTIIVDFFKSWFR